MPARECLKKGSLCKAQGAESCGGRKIGCAALKATSKFGWFLVFSPFPLKKSRRHYKDILPFPQQNQLFASLLLPNPASTITTALAAFSNRYTKRPQSLGDILNCPFPITQGTLAVNMLLKSSRQNWREWILNEHPFLSKYILSQHRLLFQKVKLKAAQDACVLQCSWI